MLGGPVVGGNQSKNTRHTPPSHRARFFQYF